MFWTPSSMEKQAVDFTPPQFHPPPRTFSEIFPGENSNFQPRFPTWNRQSCSTFNIPSHHQQQQKIDSPENTHTHTHTRSLWCYMRVPSLPPKMLRSLHTRDATALLGPSLSRVALQRYAAPPYTKYLFFHQPPSSSVYQNTPFTSRIVEALRLARLTTKEQRNKMPATQPPPNTIITTKQNLLPIIVNPLHPSPASS